MKLAIVGCRIFGDWDMFQGIIDAIDGIDEIVSGGAQGADLMAEQYAHHYKIPAKVFLADWDGLGKKAGMIRNSRIAEYADEVVAFWDGKSRGTENAIKLFEDKGKAVRIVRIDKDK